MCTKKPFSQKEAGTLVNRCKRRMKAGPKSHFWKSKSPERVYYCEECGAYHVTSLKHYEEDYDV